MNEQRHIGLYEIPSYKNDFDIIHNYFTPHTTAGLIIIESEDPHNIVHDLIQHELKLIKLVNPKFEFAHKCDRNNGLAHLLTSRITQPAYYIQTQKDSFQGLFLIDFDPIYRNRQVYKDGMKVLMTPRSFYDITFFTNNLTNTSHFGNL